MSTEKSAACPISVNYHFSRQCNYQCGFCFHTDKTSYKLPLADAKRLIKQLHDAGCKKLNFAGGEPFLPDHNTPEDNYLGEMVKYAKNDLKFESVSIISNARHITKEWFENYAKYLDILGVSCDSSIEKTNKTIGRGSGDHTTYIRQAAALCHEYNVMLKLNTVVNKFNCMEDMSALVNDIKPMRWKLFQVLALKGENAPDNNGQGVRRPVKKFLITNNMFSDYVERHRKSINNQSIMRIEDNMTMQSSYVLVDEYGRFLDCSLGSKTPTSEILTVGVETAWRELHSSQGGGFDQNLFIKRDGHFGAEQSWSKQQQLQPQEKVQKKGSSLQCGGGGCGSEREISVDIEDLVSN